MRQPTRSAGLEIGATFARGKLVEPIANEIHGSIPSTVVAVPISGDHGVYWSVVEPRHWLTP